PEGLLRYTLPVMRSGLCAALLALTLAARVSAQGSRPLPQLAIDAYPPAARSVISRAQRDASARPDDPQAVGTLARVLHAWEEWNAAHQAYARAAALAPQSAAWQYLDGIVLQRLARYADAAAAFRRALTTSPGYLPARVKLAESLLDAGDLAQAE